MLVELFDFQFFCKLLEEKQVDNIMREDNNLPIFCFLYEPTRHGFSKL